MCWGLPPKFNHQHTHTKSCFRLLYLSPKKHLYSLEITKAILFLLVFYCLLFHCQSLVWVSIKMFQSSRLFDSHACSVTPLHLNHFPKSHYYNQNKVMIAVTITKATNKSNAPHNFRHQGFSANLCRAVWISNPRSEALIFPTISHKEGHE